MRLLFIALMLLTGIVHGQVTASQQGARVSILSKLAYLYAYGAQGATAVWFPTWSVENGQDDIVWYPSVNFCKYGERDMACNDRSADARKVNFDVHYHCLPCLRRFKIGKCV